MSRIKGFSLVEVIIVVVVVVIIGALGYAGYNAWKAQNKPAEKTADTSQQQSVSEEAPEVKSTADLDTASKALDQLSITGDADAQQLSSESSSF